MSRQRRQIRGLYFEKKDGKNWRKAFKPFQKKWSLRGPQFNRKLLTWFVWTPSQSIITETFPLKKRKLRLFKSNQTHKDSADGLDDHKYEQ